MVTTSLWCVTWLINQTVSGIFLQASWRVLCRIWIHCFFFFFSLLDVDTYHDQARELSLTVLEAQKAFSSSHLLLIPKSRVTTGAITALYEETQMDKTVCKTLTSSSWLPWARKVGCTVSGLLLWADWHCPSLCLAHQQWLHSLPLPVNKCWVRYTVTL